MLWVCKTGTLKPNTDEGLGMGPLHTHLAPADLSAQTASLQGSRFRFSVQRQEYKLNLELSYIVQFKNSSNQQT